MGSAKQSRRDKDEKNLIFTTKLVCKKFEVHFLKISSKNISSLMHYGQNSELRSAYSELSTFASLRRLYAVCFEQIFKAHHA